MDLGPSRGERLRTLGAARVPRPYKGKERRRQEMSYSGPERRELYL
jgi:hypothetical protein